MKFDREELRLAAWRDSEILDVILDEIKSVSRWSIHHRMIFKHDGKFYETKYSVGATEQQDEQPFSWGPDKIECIEVVPIEKTVIDYIEA